MDWTSADLATFNIIVQDQDQDSFFDGPLPDYSGFPGFLETEDVIAPTEPRLSLAVKRAREEMDAEPLFAEWGFTLFLANLLEFMKYGYQSHHPIHTSVFKAAPVQLVVRNETASTIANVEVQRSNLMMLILQHSKTIIKRSDPEAHLIASAIGAFQQNRRVQKLAEVDLEQQVMLGITTAEQFIPTFYKIKVTAELDCAVRLGEKPVKQTIVYRHKARCPKPDEDIMTLENRRRIVLYLEGFRKLLQVQCHGWPCPRYCASCERAPRPLATSGGKGQIFTLPQDLRHLYSCRTMTTAVSFPAELIDLIVRFLWSCRLSINERVAFMTSMPFFNSAWRNAYIRASTEDVYIPCASYVDHFLSILRRESRFYDKETQARFEARCRSVTFVIAHPHAPQQGSTTEHPAGIAMADVLRFVRDKKISYVPNLRKVAIHYHNMGFNDIFEHSRLADFPSQVAELEIVHTFSPAMPDFLVSRDLPIMDEDPLSPSWSMPSIRHLTLAGVWGCYVTGMVAVCPNIVNLELDLSYGPPREIHTGEVPNSLQRLIIHAPGDVNPLKESHVECLPAVHCPTREIWLMPGIGDSYASRGMKDIDGNTCCIMYYYPANLERLWDG